MPAPQILAIEKFIARAHRLLWWAYQDSWDAGQEGVADDLFQILLELERIQEDLLKGRNRKRARADDPT